MVQTPRPSFENFIDIAYETRGTINDTMPAVMSVAISVPDRPTWEFLSEIRVSDSPLTSGGVITNYGEGASCGALGCTRHPSTLTTVRKIYVQIRVGRFWKWDLVPPLSLKVDGKKPSWLLPPTHTGLVYIQISRGVLAGDWLVHLCPSTINPHSDIGSELLY